MSATASPKVSVIVPVHNTAPWLDRCVESVRAQTLRDIEIILVENRSTDASPELCDAYPAADARIRVLHLAEAGLSRARNAGLAVATAPYVGFVDSDDYIEPDMFRRLYDAAVESGAQIAYGDLIYEEEGTPQPAEPAGPVTVRTPDEVLCDLLLERISASACTKLFDRTLFEGLQFPLDVWFASSTNGSPDAGGSPMWRRSATTMSSATAAFATRSAHRSITTSFWPISSVSSSSAGSGCSRVGLSKTRSATSWCATAFTISGRRCAADMPPISRRPSRICAGNWRGCTR